MNSSTCEPLPSAASRSPSRPSILLVGNYAPDEQQSMQRFAVAMLAGLREHGWNTELVVPSVSFGRWTKSTTEGLGKWLGYLDKFVLFPWKLRRAIRKAPRANDRPLVVHICDHSNAMYTSWVDDVPTIVTCHDLLAVRGALGESTDCPASRMGTLLQRWIVRGLRRAAIIVSVSRATEADVNRIVGFTQEGPAARLVPMGLNHHYQRLDAREVDRRLSTLDLPGVPFVLHVGSNLRRKNRDGILRIFSKVASRWNGWMVFAGEVLTPELWSLAESLGIRDRVLVVDGPDSSLLEALYNRAFALLFPSRFEGFGWPIIEAQACGCPVICSDAGPLPEVAGSGAIVCSLEDEGEFAEAILQMADVEERQRWIRNGLANARNYTTERMIRDYCCLYDGLLVSK